VLVVRDITDDRLAGAARRPQSFRFAVRVALDHRVRRGQDGLGGAVVLLQEDHPGLRVVLLELDDVPDRGTAEGIDRLVRVADHGQLRHRHLGGLLAGREICAFHRPPTGPGRAADQLADQHVLGVVGVLVLVHQHVPEPPPVVLRDVRKGLQDVHRRHDQVVEVQGVRLPQPPLVAGVSLGQHPLGV
jgi:hypothetical protein